MKTSGMVKALFLVGCFSFVQSQAAIFDSWHLRNPTPFSDTMRSICHGDGKFVAVGNGGVIHSSFDGFSWDAGKRPVFVPLNRVIYAASQFLAVGNQGTILTSSNGFDWVSQSSGTTNDLLAVAYGNGIYLACGTGGRLVTSLDGISWNVSSAGVGALMWVTFGNGVFLLPDPNSQLAVQISADGQNWNASAPFPAPGTTWTHELYQVEFGNGVFVAAASDETGGQFSNPTGHFYQSSDGTNWTLGGSFTGARINSTHRFLSFANGWFNELAVSGSFPPLTRTMDGANGLHTPMNLPVMTDARQLAFGNGSYVVVGDIGKIWTSPDGTNWISAYNGFRNTVNQIIRGENNYVAVVVGQPIYVSPDGISFIPVNTPTNLFNAVAFDGTNYVVVGGSGNIISGFVGEIYTSTNSSDWIPRTSNAAKSLLSVCRGPSRWVAVGTGGTITTSPTSLAWTLRASGTANHLNGVTFGNGQYVAVGNGGTIISSADGTTWDAQFSGTTANLNRIYFLNGQFVAVGANGTIVTSTDGVAWTPQTLSANYNLTGAAYGDGSYLIGGVASDTSNVLLQSTNGSDWTDITAKVPTADPFSMIAYLDQSFWIAGVYGSILQSDSADGIPWVSGTKVPDGFQLKVILNVPPVFRIQTSTNLSLTNSWEDLISITNASSWTDTNPVGSAQRFYRTVAP